MKYTVVAQRNVSSTKSSRHQHTDFSAESHLRATLNGRFSGLSGRVGRIKVCHLLLYKEPLFWRKLASRGVCSGAFPTNSTSGRMPHFFTVFPSSKPWNASENRTCEIVCFFHRCQE